MKANNKFSKIFESEEECLNNPLMFIKEDPGKSTYFFTA